MPKFEPKKNWTMTAEAFQRLLEWFDEGENSDGEKYLEIRQRLVSFFDRKNCLNADELADETLNRVARRLTEAEIESETPAKFCYITARFVFLESLREKEKTNVPLDGVEQKISANQTANEETEIREKRLNCLEKCVSGLETANRELIVGYYYGTERVKIENRRALAEKFGVSANALSIRACRIRDKLETCVGKCVG
jgi:DNA-directed RNA polymerase specialized sigma24 family protein